MFEPFLEDLRHAVRHLRRSPAFALVARFTLAVGIGLSGAVFSALSALVLRSAPVQDPGGLIAVGPIAMNDAGRDGSTRVAVLR